MVRISFGMLNFLQSRYLYLYLLFIFHPSKCYSVTRCCILIYFIPITRTIIIPIYISFYASTMKIVMMYGTEYFFVSSVTYFIPDTHFMYLPVIHSNFKNHSSLFRNIFILFTYHIEVKKKWTQHSLFIYCVFCHLITIIRLRCCILLRRIINSLTIMSEHSFSFYLSIYWE